MKLTVIALALFLVAPSHALDLAGRALDYGVSELGMAGAYLHVADSDDHLLEVELRAGRMMGAGMELEIEGTLQRTWDDDGSATSLGATGSFLYNIRTYASWVPFFLGGGGLSYERSSFGSQTWSETDAVVQFGLGTRFFFTDSGALRLEYRFRSRLADPESINSHRLLAGLSVFLG
ncbi:outer membrane beta-barrel protein [Candidatus Fermentibacteria bacterium]|nr:outer membrane beta-barrel protein [Candidatus Fermentibacteria bacterium]